VTETWAPVTKDADEFRVEMQADEATTRYVWDRHNIIQERDDLGSIDAEFTYQPQAYGNLISQRRDSVSSLYHFDALGSMLALTDASQVVTDSAFYKAFGEAWASSGTTLNPYEWLGQIGYYKDPITGQFMIRRRPYRTDLARFTTEDPSRQERNPYWIVTNNPTNQVDPSGLEEELDDSQFCRRDLEPRTPNPREKMFHASCDCDEDGSCRYVYADRTKRQFARYTVGTSSNANGRKSEKCVERDGKYISYELFEEICSWSAQNKRILSEEIWNEAFQFWGTNTCTDWTPPKPERSVSPFKGITSPQPQPQPSTICPPPQKSDPSCQQTASVKGQLVPSFWNSLWGEKPADIEIFYQTGGGIADTERDIAYRLLEEARRQYALGQLRDNIGVGIAGVDIAARVVFQTVDDIDSVCDFWNNPSIQTAGAVFVAVVTVYSASRLMKRTDKVDDGPREIDGESPQVRINKTSGDAARDRIALRYPRARKDVYIQTSDGPRYVDVLTEDGHAIESKEGYHCFDKEIKRQALKDIELLNDPTSGVNTVTWEFSRSPITRKVGPSKPLKLFLENNGIIVIINK